jgi:hypothetical protein
MTSNTTQNNEIDEFEEFEEDAESRVDFEQALARPAIGAELNFDNYRSKRYDFLVRQIGLRQGSREEVGDRFSGGYVLQVAADRYFQLLDNAMPSLQRRFTEGDAVLMLNFEASPIWDWQAPKTVVGFFAESICANPFKEFLRGTPERGLAEKLRRLTLVQHVALIDLLERIWRTSVKAPTEVASWSDVFRANGMELIE